MDSIIQRFFQVTFINLINLRKIGTSEVYTFGCGSYGRLGHGDHKHQNFPKVVAALRGKPIIQVACGGWFTFCLSSKILNNFSYKCFGLGILFSWGCNRYLYFTK